MSHDIVVKTYLSAEEFVALRQLAERDGHSDSSFMRHLLRVAIRRYAHDALRETATESTTTGLDRVQR